MGSLPDSRRRSRRVRMSSIPRTIKPRTDAAAFVNASPALDSFPKACTPADPNCLSSARRTSRRQVMSKIEPPNCPSTEDTRAAILRPADPVSRAESRVKGMIAKKETSNTMIKNDLRSPLIEFTDRPMSRPVPKTISAIGKNQANRRPRRANAE